MQVNKKTDQMHTWRQLMDLRKQQILVSVTGSVFSILTDSRRDTVVRKHCEKEFKGQIWRSKTKGLCWYLQGILPQYKSSVLKNRGVKNSQKCRRWNLVSPQAKLINWGDCSLRSEDGIWRWKQTASASHASRDPISLLQQINCHMWSNRSWKWPLQWHSESPPESKTVSFNPRKMNASIIKTRNDQSQPVFINVNLNKRLNLKISYRNKQTKISHVWCKSCLLFSFGLLTNRVYKSRTCTTYAACFL